MDAGPLLVLLPGLDGTGRLFDAFLEHVEGVRPQVVSYPCDRVLSVDELAELVLGCCPGEEPLFLLGESFSGRVALQVAERARSRVRGVVLVASFATNPTSLPTWMATLLPDLAFRAPPPRWLLMRLLAGVDAPENLVDELAEAIAAVSPAVLAARIREVLTRPRPAPGSLAGLDVAYLRGAGDALVGLAGVASVLDTGATVTTYEIDAPHLVLQRAPAESWRHVEAFVGSLAR